MKDKIFGVLQRVGRSFMLPIALLPVAGILLGIGSSFSNTTTIETYGMTAILGDGTLLHSLMMIFNAVGNAVFSNLAMLFAVGVAVGMAKKEKEVAALAAVVAYFVMNTAINAMLQINGKILADGSIAPDVLSGTIAQTVGIQSLQMGVFGGIIVGLGVAALHNRYYKIVLPNAVSFFGGSRFVPIVSTVVYMFVGILLYFVWPVVQSGINALGGLVQGSGYIGTLIFGLIKRALIPFGLHHVFYMPFWQTEVGGSMEVAGQMYYGGQNIFFAQLAHANEITHFSPDACRYFSGEFIFMIFGLPGAALAMYQTAKPEKKKQAGGLLLSAALASMLTGITEPIEFSFLFVAPMLFGVQVLLAGSCYMVAHILGIAVGLTFSGGLLDLFFFGILQGNAKTSWLLIIPVGIIYFLLYYFIFRTLIIRFNLKTPGREDDDVETKLYTKADYKAKTAGTAASVSAGDAAGIAAGAGTGADAAAILGGTLTAEDAKSLSIMRGLGGRKNISDVDCCATRLRITVFDAAKVDDAALKATGAAGVVHKGTGVQVIYGPQVAVIKSNLAEFLEKISDAQAAALMAEPGSDTATGADTGNGAGGSTGTATGADTGIDAGGSTETGSAAAQGRLVKCTVIYSPMTGTAAPLSECPDEAFAQKMMGDGAVVTPEDAIVAAPADGTVSMIFDTKHAIGFTTDEDLEMLIHCGIDTVKLNGEGFTVLVEADQHVSKGTPLLKLDLEYLKAHAPSVATPVLCPELEDNQQIHLLAAGAVKLGDPLYAVETYG